MKKEPLYAIIDVETTGGQAANDRITEIAIVLHNGKQVVDTFESLINPERYIPYNITELTGITQEMVSGAPRFFEVAKQIVEFTKDAVFVAHNVRFDYGFVKEEFRRLGYTFSRRQLCTVRLSRQTFPGLRSYSLGNLISHFSIQVPARHRALADAMATAQIFEMIMAGEGSVASVNQMITMGIKESKLPNNLTMEKIYELPEDCGVYYFHNERGDVVYVGKSINIQKRVLEHFADSTEKSAKLHQQVFDITCEVTGSELVALLLESNEIKRLRPAVNKAQRAFHFPYVIYYYEDENGYINLKATKNTAAVRKKIDFLAEFPKLPDAKNYLKMVARNHELCLKLTHLDTGSGACFHYHLKECKGACLGLESPDAYNERAKEAIMDLDMRFEEDLLIMDKGRHRDEKAIVVVENGRYRGFGFISAEESVSNIREIRESITPYPSNPETNKIIRHFLHSNKGVKVFKP